MRICRFSATPQSSGDKEMFPQAGSQGGPAEGGVVEVVGGEDVQARAIGTDTIDIAWRGTLNVAVPVTVATNTVSDLQIDPAPKGRSTSGRQSLTR